MDGTGTAGSYLMRKRVCVMFVFEFCMLNVFMSGMHMYVMVWEY